MLVADDQIRVSEDKSGYEFTVSDEATVTELKTNGFDIKNKTEKPLVIKAIEVQQVVVPKDIVISPESGDIAAALATASEGKKVGNITINLAAGGAYTISAPIVAPASVSIIGAEGAVIDASANTGAFISMAETPAMNVVNDCYFVGQIKIKDVKINDVKSYLIDNATDNRYVIMDMTIDNAVVKLATAGENTLTALIRLNNNQSGVKDFTIKNSTFYQTGVQNVQYFVQYSQGDPGRWQLASEETWSFNYYNSTFYKVGTGNWANTARTNNVKARTIFNVEKNIWVDCGGSAGQIAQRMVNQQTGFKTTNFVSNTYWTNGAAVNQSAYTNGEVALTTDPKFKDAANGDFTIGATTEQAKYQTGAPRWLVPYSGLGEKLYVIGTATTGDWDRTAMTEMTYNTETKAFEYEFTSTGTANFAFADNLMTAEQAEADVTWDVFNAMRYSIGAGDQTITLDTPTDIVKGVSGTIFVDGAGKFKVTVSEDLKVTVTKTGEIEHTYTVAGSFYYGDPATEVMIFGTSWDVTNTANDLEKQTDGTYKKVYENVVFEYAGNIEFKVAQDHSWDVNYGWPGSGHGDYNDNAFCEVTGTGTGTITIIFNPEGATDQDKVKIEVTGVPTAINGIDADAAGEKDVYYNLQGVRVANPGKGVYIKNGKKVLVK